MAYTPLQYPTPQFAVPRDSSQDIIRAVEMYQKQQGVQQERAMQQQQMQMNQMKMEAEQVRIEDEYRKKAEEKRDREIEQEAMNLTGALQAGGAKPSRIIKDTRALLINLRASPKRIKEADKEIEEMFDQAEKRQDFKSMKEIMTGIYNYSDADAQSMLKRMNTKVSQSMGGVVITTQNPETGEIEFQVKEAPLTEEQKADKARKVKHEELGIKLQEKALARPEGGGGGGGVSGPAPLKPMQRVTVTEKLNKAKRLVAALPKEAEAAILRLQKGEDPSKELGTMGEMTGSREIVQLMMSLEKGKQYSPGQVAAMSTLIRQIASDKVEEARNNIPEYMSALGEEQETKQPSEPGAKDETGTSGNPLKAAMERKQGLRQQELIQQRQKDLEAKLTADAQFKQQTGREPPKPQPPKPSTTVTSPTQLPGGVYKKQKVR